MFSNIELGEIKTRIKRSRNQHDVHVGLLMMAGLSKPDAIVMAYLDGYAGLADRMTPDKPASTNTAPAKPEATK